MARVARLGVLIDSSGAKKGAQEANGALDSMSKTAERTMATFRQAAQAIGVSLAGIGFASLVRDAQSFEKQMALISTVLDETTGSTVVFREELQKLFRSLPVGSMQELSKGLYDIVSAGIPAGDAMAYLNVAARASIAGVTSTATAVDVLTTATNAWRLQSLTAQQASDQMFMAVNKGKMTFEELSSAMGTIAPIAAGYGISLRDVLGATAQLTLNGLSATEAMTGIRSAITNIINPTGALAQEFPSLAKEFNATKLEAVGFTQFLIEFNKAAGGSKEAINALFTDVQGKTAVFSLLADAGRAAADQVKAVGQASGATDVAFGKLANTSAAAAQLLRNQFASATTDLATVALPAVNAGMGALTTSLDFIRTNGPALAGIVTALGAGWAAYAVAVRASATWTAILGAAQTVQAFVSLAATIRSTADAMALLSMVGKGAAGAVAAVAGIVAGFAAYKIATSTMAADTKKFNEELQRTAKAQGVVIPATDAAADAARRAAQEEARRKLALEGANKETREGAKAAKELQDALDAMAFSSGTVRENAIKNAVALRQFVEPVKMSFAEVLKLVQAQEKAANVAAAHANAVRLGIADTVSYRAEVLTATQVEELRSKGITITTAMLERLAAANMKLVQAQDAANGTTVNNMKAAKDWDSALQSVATTMRDISQALNGTGNDAVKMIGLLATALDQLARAQQRAEQMRQSKQTMSGTQRAATAVGGAVGAFGVGYGVGSMTSSRTVGALGGAAAGAATGAAAGTVIPGVGNIIGAVVGGLIGGIGGLLGASKNATQELIAQRAAQQQLNEALNTMRASFSGDGLSQALSQASAQFVQLRQQTEAAFSGKKNEAERNRVLAELNALETQRLALIRQQYEESMRLAMGDLSVRQMRAAGADVEAQRLAESLAAQREMNEATEKFGKDSPYVAQLKKVQEAEAAAAEATRARVEAQKAADRTAFGLDITQRRQTLNGDSRGAFITGQTIANNSALAQAQDLFDAGTITKQMFEDLKTLLGDEFVDALKRFDEAAREAKQAVLDDLTVRALVATGKSAEAEQKRIEIANANELRGVTDEGLRAQILYVQGLEAVARATAAAAEAERIRQEQNASIDQRMIEALRILDPERAKELEAKQLEVDRAREIAEAADAATAARLRELFAMQDAAKALAMVTEEMERQKKAAEELADFTRSIGSQYLRSQGKNFDADLADLNDWRTEQLKRAASVGAGADVISQINAIYDARYGALIAAQMKADTPAPVTTPASFGGSTAADSSITLGEDTVAVRSARSITEATALQLVDYAASQTALLRRLVQLAEGGSGPTGSALASPSLDMVDRQLGARANTASLLLAGSVR